MSSLTIGLANLYKNNIIALRLYLFLKNKEKVRVTALNDLAYSS